MSVKASFKCRHTIQMWTYYQYCTAQVQFTLPPAVMHALMDTPPTAPPAPPSFTASCRHNPPPHPDHMSWSYSQLPKLLCTATCPGRQKQVARRRRRRPETLAAVAEEQWGKAVSRLKPRGHRLIPHSSHSSWTAPCSDIEKYR